VSAPPIGKVVDGRYRIECRIGAGGMGEVYAARQLNVDRRVALKLLRPERIGDEAAVARFLEEARAVGSLTSPHTVTLHDAGTMEDGAPYLAMELLEGATLRAHMASGPLDVDEAIRTVDAIALALDEAHRRGIIHRDLKPANVFVANTPGHVSQIKVLDFGLAQVVGDPSDDGRTGGTLLYMAPEALRGGEITPRTDVYALAMVTYEMLTGRHPFKGKKRAAVVDAQLHEVLPTLDEACDAALPKAFVALVSKGLAKPARLRPKDAGAFRRAMRRAFDLPLETRTPTPKRPSLAADATIASETVVSRTLETPAPDRPRARWLAAAAVAAALLGAFALRVSDGADSEGSAVPAPAPQTVAIAVDSEPSGASLRVGGDLRGHTPMTLTVAHGDHDLELEVEAPGFGAVHRTIRPTQDTTVVIQLASPRSVASEPSVDAATASGAVTSSAVTTPPTAVRPTAVRPTAVRPTAARPASPGPASPVPPAEGPPPAAAPAASTMSDRVHDYLD
jgi:eukaryotic-like serine/threonine-protein kinase